MIPQLIPTITPAIAEEMERIAKNPQLLNGKYYSSLCEEWLTENCFPNSSVMLTNSGTRALELIALLIDIKEGDEVIMPSYTFVGTANPFVTRGAKPIFVDIEKDSISLDPLQVEKAINKKTKAIIHVSYNAVGKNLKAIAAIAKKHGLIFIEDNAQGFLAEVDGQALGSFGDFSILSFNYTKNIQCGEGGAIVINNPAYKKRCETLYQLGTNRMAFERKETKSYEWKDVGGKFFPSQLEAAFLYPQLKEAYQIIERRQNSWDFYHEQLKQVEGIELIADLPVQYPNCQHNGHIYYLVMKSVAIKKQFLGFLAKHEIKATFHYIPLHQSSFGKEKGEFIGSDENTNHIGQLLIRLPLYHEITEENMQTVVQTIQNFIKTQDK